MQHKAGQSAKKSPSNKTKGPKRSIKNVLNRWRQNREPKKYIEEKTLNSTNQNPKPAATPAFTLADAIKHIFTNRKISEIETLLDSYPADVQQIIASFLGAR